MRLFATFTAVGAAALAFATLQSSNAQSNQSQADVSPGRISFLSSLTNADQIIAACNQKLIVNDVEVAWAVSNRLARLNVTNLSSLQKAYQEGLITKGEAMQQESVFRNKSVDMYGKVVDQYGQPVVGVKVQGNLTITLGFMSERNEGSSTETDTKGMFQFIGLTGSQLGVTVSKKGYVMGARGEGYKTPAGGKTSPDDRAILTMWKLRGPEPLVSSSFESSVAYDGTSSRFDLATQKKSPDGDLQVTLSRSPLEVRRSGNRFDWDVKIEMLHGGLVPENDPYPYWAADNGYQSSFEFNMITNNVPWRSTMAQNFYIRSSHGQYGRMQVNVYANLTPARIKFDFWINPSGSQNLEPSPSK